MGPTPQVRIAPAWATLLEPAFQQPSFAQLVAFLKAEKARGKVIYPPGGGIFHAFELTPPEGVKVVLLGQDPYHNPGQAEGLSFSVPRGVAPPPSLQNMFKELQADLGIAPAGHGHLAHWATQGVLLLNTSLTSEQGIAGAHAQKGWEPFTDFVIQTVSQHRQRVVFLLWGAHARKKKPLIDAQKHLILEAAHPSPLSAHNGFFGCRHFSACNRWLQEQGLAPIDWQLPV